MTGLDVPTFRERFFEYVCAHGKDGIADLVFQLGEHQVFTDHSIVKQFCAHLPFEQEGEGGTKIITVPEAVAVRSLHQFVKVLYVGALDSIPPETLLQVRQLGVLYQANELTLLCDNYKVVPTEDNCHILLQEWPKEHQVHKGALNFVIKNLPSLIPSSKTNNWGFGTWKVVLELCRRHGSSDKFSQLKNAVYSSVQRWREAPENTCKDSDFVKMCKLMDTSFLFAVVKRKELLSDKLISDLAEYHYRAGGKRTFKKSNEDYASPAKPKDSEKPNQGGTSSSGNKGDSNTRTANKSPKSTSDDDNRHSSSKKVAKGTKTTSTPQPPTRVSSPSSSSSVVPQTQSPKAIKQVKDFEQFLQVLKTVEEGDTIVLGEGTFRGQLTLELPKDVRITGMGKDKTLVTADEEDFVWEISSNNGKRCIIENMQFFSNPKTLDTIEDYRDPDTNRRGLWASGSKLMVGNCAFSQCCLEITTCIDSTFMGLTFDSSHFGIQLSTDSSGVLIKDITLKKVAIGISCWGEGVRIRDLKMTHVDAGVVIQAEDENTGTHNTVQKMRYTFDCSETFHHQVAAEIFGCKRNKLEDLECLGYTPIPTPVEDGSDGEGKKVGDRIGIRISNHDTNDLIAKSNRVVSFKGGPVIIGGTTNKFKDLTQCDINVVAGKDQEFRNTEVICFKQAKNTTIIKKEDCNFAVELY